DRDCILFKGIRNRGGSDSLALDELERRHILKVLEHTKGNKAETARLLGIGIATLYRKLESYGVK
uniref:helix-turn-helix domain-containing protein n=1 Tax=uncultured Alistipes sp. TaxID=538949 RepID=UPI00258DA665